MTKQLSFFAHEEPVDSIIEITIEDDKRVLMEHDHDIPPPRVAVFYPDWCGSGPTWVLSCELVVYTEEEARAFVKTGDLPLDEDDEN